MNSLTFAGWVGDDVLRVLKTHVPIALQGIEKTDDLTKMQTYVAKMKEQIRSSKFKSLNIKLVGNVYILYIGKSIEHSTDTISAKEIPNKLIEDCINYISHIKDGKIGRTKYPVIHNILYSNASDSQNKVSTSAPLNGKNNSKESHDSDEDSLDKTEAINNIIRKKTPKNDPVKLETPTTKRESKESQSSAKKQVEDEDIEYSNIEIPEKNVKFEDEIVVERESEEPETPEAQVKTPIKSGKSEKSEKPEKSEKVEKTNPPETISRKQRRKQLVDDAEESRWEGLN